MESFSSEVIWIFVPLIAKLVNASSTEGGDPLVYEMLVKVSSGSTSLEI